MPFISRWTPENHFWGVVAAENNINLDRDKFACCGGDGVAIDPSNPRDARLCGLSRRWNLLHSVVKQWSRGPRGEETPWSVLFASKESDDRNAAVGCLEDFLKSGLDSFLRSSKGEFFSTRKLTKAPKYLESQITGILAAILAWHFETVTLIADLRESSIPVNFWQELLVKHPKARVIMLVEGASELWVPVKLEAFEAVIAFASERRIPVWVHDRPSVGGSDQTTGTAPSEKSRSFRSAMAKRLESHKQKQIHQWLSEQGRSRLSELCDLPRSISQSRDIPDFV